MVDFALKLTLSTTEKGTAMSFEIVPGDYYPFEVRRALEGTKRYLVGGTRSSAEELFSALEIMKHSQPFDVVRRSGQPMFAMSGDGLEKREPVWKVIREVAAQHDLDPNIGVDNAVCAEWLQRLLQQVVSHEKIQKAIISMGYGLTKEERAAIKIEVDPELSGANAKALLAKVVDELIPAVQALQE
jgi:hypothetical protein